METDFNASYENLHSVDSFALNFNINLEWSLLVFDVTGNKCENYVFGKLVGTIHTILILKLNF